MGREKKRIVPGPRTGVHARERHKRFQRARTLDIPVTALNARPEPPNMKSKHHSYYELVENKDKKKKLEFEITSKKTPPPGFEFVSIGNLELTQACKELSREQDAMIFVVSNSSHANSLIQQVNRIGHHIRQGIVEQARREVSDAGDSSDDQARPGAPEPIPKSQKEINEQADSAIRELFPRIPNTDRQTIIEHSFKLGAHKHGEPLVGLAPDIPLSRRVQLAVLAHIRHTHTRYDKLLRETTYANARKAVEQLCLDVLVKWRGDEENGRDQLDEILREVIVISDSEGEDDDGDDEEADSSGVESGDLVAEPSYLPYPATRALERRAPAEATISVQHRPHPPADARIQSYYDEDTPIFSEPRHSYVQEGHTAHRARRGFKRYQAALSTRWDEAVDRVRHQRAHQPDVLPATPPVPAEYHQHTHHEPQHPVQRPPSHTLYASNAQGTPYHGNTRNDLHPLELPARFPIRAMSAAVHQRSLSGGLSRGTSPYPDLRQAPPPQRILVRSNEARDYLVPSVEPLSPPSESRPIAPVFVRTVSPRLVSRPSRGPVSDVWSQPRVRDSPGWAGEQASVKRRRPVDDEPYNPREPPQPPPQRRMLSNGWQQPVHYAAVQPVNTSPRLVSERDSRPHLAHAPAESGARHPVTAPSSYSYYEDSRTRPPLGSEHAPIVLNDWDGEPSSVSETFPVRDYRGNAISERRDPPFRVVRARGDDSYYEPEVEPYYREPVDYAGGPSSRGGQSLVLRPAQAPHNTVPIRLGPSLIERPTTHVPRAHDFNHPGTRPADNSPAAVPVMHPPTGYYDDPEPAPRFVRRVDRRYEQTRPIEVRNQPAEYYDQGPSHVYRDHQPSDNSWAPPQANPPFGGPYDSTPGHPHHPDGQPQYHTGGYNYQGHPNQHDHQYNRQGP